MLHYSVTYYINTIEPDFKRTRELYFHTVPTYEEIQKEIAKIFEKKYFEDARYLSMIKLISYPQIID